MSNSFSDLVMVKYNINNNCGGQMFPDGTTVADVLKKLSVSTAKVTILLNGDEVTDFDVELKDNDLIETRTKFYNSGVDINA